MNTLHLQQARLFRYLLRLIPHRYQIMRYTMTIATFREFSQNALRMRFAMTTLTFWYHFMFFLMTFRAQELTMFGMTYFQHLESIGMARATAPGRHFRAISHFQRHVGLMAHPAIIHHHKLRMTIMTLEAVRQDSVLIMTTGAGQCRMRTLMLF